MMTLAVLLALTQPTILHGQLAPRGTPTSLPGDLRALGDGWGGYAVPIVEGRHPLCGGVVSLDDGTRRNDDEAESTGELALFFHVESGRVTQLRVLGTECRLDAGGRTIAWWTSVGEEASLAFLDELARSSGEDLAEDAVMATAMHRSETANGRLERLATGASARDLRDKALFWLGAARGAAGFQVLSRLASSLEETELREEVAFALHVSDAEGATERLVAMAKSDRSPDVRSQALFWLSQEAGDVATRAIRDAVETDPDVELKEKAVFALSQLPPDEGVPLLIDFAETHPEPRVRNKALFWLGQSNDPRALALFERILLER